MMKKEFILFHKLPHSAKISYEALQVLPNWESAELFILGNQLHEFSVGCFLCPLAGYEI